MVLFGCADSNVGLDNLPSSTYSQYPNFFSDTLWANHFNYPVGIPNGNGYYNAQGFGKNTHLGDDWNGNGGGNTDLGDTVYAIANGYVTEASDLYGGWGNVVRIAHFLRKGHSYGPAVESLYAHLDTIFVKPGKWVNIGAPIGTIGNAHGQYYSHLHLEIREQLGLPLGGGYAADTTGYINPTWFIKANR
jgi:murein DD-endopeptidase MepM/ murein hydrolase activator NlpD